MFMYLIRKSCHDAYHSLNRNRKSIENQYVTNNRRQFSSNLRTSAGFSKRSTSSCG